MTDVSDLTDAIPEESAVLEILKRDGSKTGWRIELSGPFHPKALAWSDAQQRKGLERASKLEQQQLNGRKIKAEERTVEEVRRDNVEWISSRILGFSPIRVPFLNGGETIEYSEAAVATVFMEPRMGWALAQIVEYLNDEKSFTKASPKD